MPISLFLITRKCCLPWNLLYFNYIKDTSQSYSNANDIKMNIYIDVYEDE